MGLAILVFLSIAGAQTVQQLLAQTVPPPISFEEGPCVGGLDPGSARAPFAIVCGVATVPELYRDPNGPKIQLPVIVFDNRAPDSKQDPLFLLQGGPGASTIDTYADAVLYGIAFANFERDVVLFDQRGTKNAEPSLRCESEEMALVEQTIERNLSDAEELSLSTSAFATCHNRLMEEGVNFAAFNSLENASDIEAIRRLLGYNKINLYGVSYGTLLALHYMRDFPDSLRTVVLDAVVPTQLSFLAEIARSGDRSFDELFSSCSEDAACQSAFPNLEQEFYDLVVQLDADPLTIAVGDPITGRVYNAVYDGDELLSTLFGSLYVDENIPIMPLIIRKVSEGKTRYLSANMAGRLFDRDLSTGMYNAVICSEDGEMLQELTKNESLHPLWLANRQQTLRDVLADCATLDVPPLPDVVNDPVVSSIPTLILNGQFDPITPPEFGAIAAQTLANSYSFTFPSVGHGAVLSNECPQWIMYQFLEEPRRQPDARCIDDLPPLDFVVPGELVYTGVPNEIRFALSQVMEGRNVILAFWRTSILVVCTLILLSIVLVWPTAWFIQRRHQRRESYADVTDLELSEQRDLSSDHQSSEPDANIEADSRGKLPLLLRWSGWIAFGGAFVATLFLIGMAVVVVFEFSVATDLISIGVPRMFAPVFVLPLVMVGLTIFMLIASIAAWIMRQYWRPWRRIYYAILTVAAVVYVSVLLNLGLVTSILE
ncbi:alpha/beta fold hydrolase [Chloroflexi bacterium TSY]|nr:alpha/beta fold hydrolase [Chloroflexi bacterium TSY]